MRARTYVVVLLLVAGNFPLLAYGYLSIEQSKKTTVSEVVRTNRQLGRAAAEQISKYLRHEQAQLRTAGIGMLLATKEGGAQLGGAYLLNFSHWHNLTVLDRGGASKVEVPSVGYLRPRADAEAALRGAPDFSDVRAADPARVGPFAHSMSLALPLYVVGALRGAVMADIDLISLWEPINAIRVGERGFVRLVTSDGTVLAHGHVGDREDVFAGHKRPGLLRKAERAESVESRQGERLLTSLSRVEGTDWSVIIEQPASEALAAAHSMQRNLIALILATGLCTTAIGLWAGRGLVRSLEVMEAHTRTLAGGDLSTIVAVRSPVLEVTSLAQSIDTMAISLSSLHEEARAKDRIMTFGRVAAGLAHDLRLPIETIQEATYVILDNFDDQHARQHFEWTARNEIPRLRRYLEDLKNLAADGRVGLHFNRANVAELLGEVEESMVALPKWKGVTFRIQGACKDAKMDAELLRRAFYNLAANGADSTLAQRRGSVTLKMEDVEGDTGGEMLIRFIDDGCGMSEEALGRLLSGDFCSTKRANGVGLGFGVARHIVQSHGGTITGTSEEGVGTTLTVRLPRIQPGQALEGEA